MESPSVRPGTPADHAAVHDIVAQAFGQEDEARLVEALRGIEGFDPRLSLVAEIAGAIAGHILFTAIGIVDGGTSTPAQALAPVAVAPAWQRRGIGTVLIHAGLDVCRELGHGIVVVLGHAAYYPRFGFEAAGIHGIAAHRCARGIGDGAGARSRRPGPAPFSG